MKVPGKLLCIMLVVAITVILAGCLQPLKKKNSDDTKYSGVATFPEVTNSPDLPGSIERNASAENAIIDANNQFAFDLYSNLSRNTETSGRNILFSPLSIASAFALTYEGARTNTGEEIRTVFHFPADDRIRRQGFVGVYADLNRKNTSSPLRTTNALWAEQTYPFLPEYTTTAAKYYGAATRNLDFKNSPEASRAAINAWAVKNTGGKITGLVPEGMINPLTRLVITNAVHFRGTWVTTFKRDETKEAEFKVTPWPWTSVRIPMMHQSKYVAFYPYGETEKLQVLALPYGTNNGKNFSMLVILPKENDLSYAEAVLNDSMIADLKQSMRKEEIEVFLPRFSFTSSCELPSVLSAMGMPTGFRPGKADLSGMDDSQNLYISDAIHKATIDVNEEGTEATAAIPAWAVTQGIPPVFRADHPFVFLIQDDETGNILFIGRVVNPVS